MELQTYGSKNKTMGEHIRILTPIGGYTKQAILLEESACYQNYRMPELNLAAYSDSPY